MSTRKTTVKDIAAKAGVSVSLVSFVMRNRAQADGSGKLYRVSDETSQRILEAAEALDYQPNAAARSLRSGKTNTIGVIVSDISNRFFADIGRYIEDVAYKLNYTVFYGSSDESPEKFESLITAMIARGVDGLIVVPCEKCEKSIAKITEAGLPLVLLDRDVENVEANRVLLNNHRAGYLATEYLINKGCKKIEMVSYAMRLSNIRDREAGYKAAMTEYGLRTNANIYGIKFKNIPAQIAKIFDEILKGEVDGIVFATNTLTIEGVRRLRQIAPELMSRIQIAAFDESEAFDLSDYKIAYIKQPIGLLGTESVRILLDCIASSSPKFVSTVLSPELVEP